MFFSEKVCEFTARCKQNIYIYLRLRFIFDVVSGSQSQVLL
jgi:hypothetical protein